MSNAVICPVCKSAINIKSGKAYIEKDSDGYTIEKLSQERDALLNEVNELKSQIEEIKKGVKNGTEKRKGFFEEIFGSDDDDDDDDDDGDTDDTDE